LQILVPSHSGLVDILLHFSALVIVRCKRLFASILLHENSEEIRVHLAAKQVWARRVEPRRVKVPLNIREL